MGNNFKNQVKLFKHIRSLSHQDHIDEIDLDDLHEKIDHGLLLWADLENNQSGPSEDLNGQYEWMYEEQKQLDVV